MEAGIEAAVETGKELVAAAMLVERGGPAETEREPVLSAVTEVVVVETVTALVVKTGLAPTILLAAIELAGTNELSAGGRDNCGKDPLNPPPPNDGLNTGFVVAGTLKGRSNLTEEDGFPEPPNTKLAGTLDCGVKGDLAVPALNTNVAGLELKPVLVPARFGTEEGAAVVNTGIIGCSGNEDVVEVPPRLGAKPWPYGLPVDVEGVDFVLILVGTVALVEADPAAADEEGPEVYDIWLLAIEELCMVRGELETGITGAVAEGVVVV